MDDFAAEFRLLRERFARVHQEGLESLRTGDLDYLVICLLLERKIMDEQARLTSRLFAATSIDDRRQVLPPAADRPGDDAMRGPR
jgi:hypothetical protein